MTLKSGGSGDPAMDTTISRRGLLASSLKLGISGVVLGSFSPLGACQKSPSYRLAETIRYLAHCAQVRIIRSRARALVCAGLLVAIQKLVRDVFRLVSAEGFSYTFGAIRKFGKRAALRAGAGTAREKAEILADLLNQAGANAEMVDIFRPTGEQAESYVYRAFSQPFEPDIPDGQVENWMTRLEMPELPPNDLTGGEIQSDGRREIPFERRSEERYYGLNIAQTYGDRRLCALREDGSYLLADPIDRIWI